MMRIATFFAVLLAVLASQTTQAGLPDLPVVVYKDSFDSHADGANLWLAPEVGPAGNTWEGYTLHKISNPTGSDGKVVWTDVANSSNVKYLAPTDRKFSIEAVVSDRDLDPPNQNVVLGFADSTPHNPDGYQPSVRPGANISGRTGLGLAINGGGMIGLWENSFAKNVVSGKYLTEVGLTNDYQGDIPIKLQMDPVNNRAVAEVNGEIVYDIAYDITDPNKSNRLPITWAGFAWSGMQSGAWDDFAVREAVPEPGSLTLLGLGSLLLVLRRKRS